MSSGVHYNNMPNKDSKAQVAEVRTLASPVQLAPKAAGTMTKAVPTKPLVKDTDMSPTPQTELERTELLGSLTTQQQQRTSARVIKKLKLEPTGDKDKRKRPDGSDEIPECDTPNKIDEKDPLKFPTVKQRMPKALWSTDEKSLFFEALNEYGKDFDAITAYICAKMKKKGMADANLKTKTQVSHFYYRTWHKLSKHVHFDENVKKVVQELYALINYGELRKKLVSVNEKTCARLGEMVLGGSMVVRARGRNLRVRTPMCRALRQLNQITERACGSRVCSRALVTLRARDGAAWARVQAAAHNPRAAASLPLRARLAALLAALQKRWAPNRKRKPDKLLDSLMSEDGIKSVAPEEGLKENEEPAVGPPDCHLGLRTDRIILQEQKLPKRPVLHVGPRPCAEVHLPAIGPSEPLSSHKICFSSYLERITSQRRDKDSGAKIRTPKRQRKDSTTDVKDSYTKKFKLDDDPIKSFSIDETAIDGIELMAHYKHHQDDEEKPSTEDEKELKGDDIGDEHRHPLEDEVDILDKDAEKDISERDKDALDRDKYMSEREKDSFSELEDDEKYNKSESDNESDQGKSKERKFTNLKVKFRIRQKKRGGVYAMVVDKDPDPDDPVKDDPMKDESVKDEDSKPDFDVDMAVRQVRRGWSVFDAGDLTIGDLYLMFGSRSKLELDYWWAEPTPPLPKKAPDLPSYIEKERKMDKTCDKIDKLDKICDKLEKVGDKLDKTAEKDKSGDKDSSVEEEKRESDTDIFSPKNTYGQDSNDGLSGDDRKSEQLASPEHKSAASATFKLVNKLINRPDPPATQQNGFSLLSDRLKRLLALVGNPHVGGASLARCACGHVCNQRKPANQQKQASIGQPVSTAPTAPRPDESLPVFRHPTPIAPRPDTESGQSIDLSGVPRWRRGRPRAPVDRRVVVQRLLPLLPKLPPPANLIPVRIVPHSPQPPKILPKPPPTATSDLSLFYVLSESNGQFFFHDGDRKIPITPQTDPRRTENNVKSEEDLTGDDVKPDICGDQREPGAGSGPTEQKPSGPGDGGNPDIANFLPSESLSLSPSRLLRDTDGWLDSSVQDFSLSSFLGHLEGRPQPDLAVDSHLQSLMAESSVDYVAKFADLAAEVTDDNPLPPGDLT